jgi:MATE family multidrug resistance protein
MAKAAFFGAVECAAESWPLELTNAVAGLINVPSIDAHTVVLNSCLFISLGLPLGMSVSSSARIPQLLEAGDAIGAQRTAIVAGVTTFVYNAICALLLIASRWNMGHVFTKDQEVTENCASVAGMAAIFTLFDGMQTVLAGILRGLGHRRIVTLLNFGGMGCIGLPLAFFFAIQAGYGLIGIWLGLVIGVVSLTISYAAMLSTVDWTRAVGAWQRQAIVSRDLDALSSPSSLPPPQTPPVLSRKDVDVSVDEGGSPSELERRSPSILDERERMI